MVAENRFAHEDAQGHGPAFRAARAGYVRRTRRWAIGENLAWGQGAAAQPALIVQQWMASPPHRAIILDPEFREGGAGIANGLPIPGGEDGQTIVLLLGVRR
jgi:uncharacterized protein YkwD